MISGSIRVMGGNKLYGEVTPIPNKNSIVSALPAAILADEDVVYGKVPQTSDVEKILEILRLLGARVDREGDRVVVNCQGVNSYKVDKDLGGEFRGSLMFAGPLLARFGKAWVPVPGGCDLGFRSIAAHVEAFAKVGVKTACEKDGAWFSVEKRGKDEYRVWQKEASVTATENLAMYAAGVEKKIEIIDAAAEPHVSDILRLLVAMGAKISGIGSNRLEIKGRKKLEGAAMEAGPDFVDIAGIMAAVGIAGGKVRIKGANIDEIVGGLRNWFELFGIKIEEEGKDLVVSREGKLRIDQGRSDVPLAEEGLPKLAPRPWPGFPVDVIPVMAALACKAEGKLQLQNWMYESGFDFVKDLNQMGADIFMADSQKIIVKGPVKFRGGEVTPPQVIQAVKAVFLAALADPCETIIHGTDILRRRYPDIFSVYRSLGAEIQSIEGVK